MKAVKGAARRRIPVPTGGTTTVASGGTGILAFKAWKRGAVRSLLMLAESATVPIVGVVVTRIDVGAETIFRASTGVSLALFAGDKGPDARDGFVSLGGLRLAETDNVSIYLTNGHSAAVTVSALASVYSE
jgi:hypothetical protein